MVIASTPNALSRILLLTLTVSPFLFAQTHAASPVSVLLPNANFPVALAFAPDGRIFFTEKNAGNIRIIQSNGTLLSTPFATVPNLFYDGETGLLGIALDPSFATNHYVYAYYTYRDSSNYTRGHIIRYTDNNSTGTNPTGIFDVTSSAPGTLYHNGGYIKFGPDGKLYAMVGEFHQEVQAQNMTSLTGKLLRMNTDGTVPADNPFGIYSLDYATGIRNSFGFDFDTSRNRLIATMAGPSSDDKILIIPRGANIGWPTCLSVCHDPRFINATVDFNPVVTPTGIATIAQDTYVFGEWNTGNLVQLNLDGTGGVLGMTTIDNESGGIVAVEHGPGNKLYYTTPTTIYTYNLPVTPSPAGGPNNFNPILTIVELIAASAAITLLALTATRYVRRRPPTVAKRIDG